MDFIKGKGKHTIELKKIERKIRLNFETTGGNFEA